jgi:ubiquitin carboxyl-terminal hydrolase 9/24
LLYTPRLLKLLWQDAPVVIEWMNQNRRAWRSIERDLFEQYAYHSRSDYSIRRDNGNVGLYVGNHHQSDSDGMRSDDDDDDSRCFDGNHQVDDDNDITEVLVSNAGFGEVNGSYSKDGVHDRAYKFSKRGVYNNKEVIYSLFKCNVSNNTQHWYISIVPHNVHPGTSSDIDFYSAEVKRDSELFPPLSGWTRSSAGIDPSPTLQHVVRDKDSVPFVENSPSSTEHRSQQRFV